MNTEDVVVYVSDDCNECNKVLSWLKEQDVSFKEKNTTKNKAFMKQLQSQHIYGTPAIFIDDKKILGFQKTKLVHALGLSSAG